MTHDMLGLTLAVVGRTLFGADLRGAVGGMGPECASSRAGVIRPRRLRLCLAGWSRGVAASDVTGPAGCVSASLDGAEAQPLRT